MILLQEYKKYIWDIFNPSIRDDSSKTELYLWGKLVNEVAEFADAANKVEGEDKILDEAGDVCWYLFNLENLYKISFELTTLDLYLDILPSNMLIVAGVSYGSILKKFYHGKIIDQDQIINQLRLIKTILIGYMELYKISLDDIIDNNYRKLKERHGNQYNSGFYKK